MKRKELFKQLNDLRTKLVILKVELQKEYISHSKICSDFKVKRKEFSKNQKAYEQRLEYFSNIKKVVNDLVDRSDLSLEDRKQFKVRFPEIKYQNMPIEVVSTLNSKKSVGARKINTLLKSIQETKEQIGLVKRGIQESIKK